MLNLLNAAAYWFTKDQNISWIQDSWTKWIWWVAVVLGIVFLLMIIVLFFKALRRTKQRQKIRRARKEAEEAKAHEEAAAVVAPAVEKKEEERQLLGISLEMGIVQRHFTVGDEFKCDGLIVKGHYNTAPVITSVVGYAIVDDVEYKRLAEINEPDGAFVLRPNMSEAGIKYVVVKYGKYSLMYTISVSTDDSDVQKLDAPVEQQDPQPAPQEKQPETVIVEKVVEVPVEKVVEKVVEVPVAQEIERKLLYITLVTDDVQKVFTVGEAFNCDNLVIRAHYNTEPYIELPQDYAVNVPNLNKVGQHYVGVRYGEKSVGYQIVVKEPEPQPEPTVVEKIVEVPAEPQPAPEPVVVEKVIEKVVEVPVEKIVEQPKVVETIIIGEESVEASRLRYDKSFEAKLIQSEDEVKYWYTDLKNELLSYKGCKGRISWKRETFKAKKEVVAKLVFRGNTLCLFLPLKIDDYQGRSEIEDASNIPVYEDTPVLIRIKNEKRKRIASELIAEVMAEREILHGSYQPEDYYVPYEGVMELINRGLIKREIKTVEDEAIFDRDKQEE